MTADKCESSVAVNIREASWKPVCYLGEHMGQKGLYWYSANLRTHPYSWECKAIRSLV